MNRRVMIGDVFRVQSGDFHAVDKELAPGDIPLVSCGDMNHGLVGYFSIPEEQQYQDALTVAYNGIPLTAKYRPYRFGAKDDIAVLEPHKPMSPRILAYFAAVLNARRWRYSYGRKCFKRKLEVLEIEVDTSYAEKILREVSLDKRPLATQGTLCSAEDVEWSEVRLNEIFNLTRGNFHSLKDLELGTLATVSRTELDNGVVGYFEKHDNSIIHPPGLITISTVTGDAFVQMERFQATDNVVVCIPRKPMRYTTTYLITAIINSQKWRYGYGRQPYVGKLSTLSILVPWRDGRIDEGAASLYIDGQPYWQFVKDHIDESKRQQAVREWQDTPSLNPQYQGATPADVGRALLSKPTCHADKKIN